MRSQRALAHPGPGAAPLAPVRLGVQDCGGRNPNRRKQTPRQPQTCHKGSFQGTLRQNGATRSTLQIPLQPNYSLSIALHEMLYESCACPGECLGAPLVSRGCFPGVLRTSPVSAIRAAMRRCILQAFSSQRIFPAMPCARLGPLRSAVARKGLHSKLAGGIFEHSSKNRSPITDSTEVAPTKRNP